MKKTADGGCFRLRGHLPVLIGEDKEPREISKGRLYQKSFERCEDVRTSLT